MIGLEQTTIQEDRERVMILDQLYIEDGRHRKEHKYHGVYTDLYQGWLREQKKAIIERHKKRPSLHAQRDGQQTHS